MLQTRSVHTPTLELLKQLLKFESLSNFHLVGGTALALQFGHRISEDIDLFTQESFSSEELERSIFEKLNGANIAVDMAKENTLKLRIDHIKVDLLYYPYRLIDMPLEIDGIRMLSIKDIAAMKLSAVSKRGAKKDFFDIYELLQEKYTLKEMLDHYKTKYENHALGFLTRSLLYFDDAELEPDPVMIKNYNWQEVKKEISSQVRKLIIDK